MMAEPLRARAAAESVRRAADAVLTEDGWAAYLAEQAAPAELADHDDPRGRLPIDMAEPPIVPWIVPGAAGIPASPPEGRRGHAATPSGFTTLTFRDLLAQPPDPPPFLAEGIAPKVGDEVLAGSPKIGKTLWASQLALSVASGLGEFLGRPCGSGPVLWIAEEGSLAGLSYRVRRQMSALGVTGQPSLTIAHRQRVRLDDRRSVAQVRETVAALRPVLVVLDPLNRLHGADENRPTQMTPIMDALAGIAYDYACCVLAIHHLAKPSQERRGTVWDRFRGASAIRSGTDANLAMEEAAGDAVRLVGEFRDAEPLEMALELDRDSLVFRPLDGPRIITKIDPEALLALVRDRSQVTAATVMATFGVSKKTALAAMRDHPVLDVSTIDAKGTLVAFLREAQA